jgi:glutamine amidotransferase-like uncharacterized protein
MGTGYLNHIRNFVANGGGYVGFCAGAFLTTAKIGTSAVNGLGIVPGRTELWDKEDGPGKMIQVSWNHQIRSVYYHGGPFLDLTGVNDSSVNVYSRYENGQVAGATFNFGKGKIAITGAHPEASVVWKMVKIMQDEDGSDQPLVMELMKWAAP